MLLKLFMYLCICKFAFQDYLIVMIWRLIWSSMRCFLSDWSLQCDWFQSTGSFFHEKSITLGSLIGVSTILELSRRSTRGGAAETVRGRKNNVYKPKPWLFSLCSKLSTDAVNTSSNNTPSLGHFLEAERRSTAGIYRVRNLQSPTIDNIAPRDFSPATLPISNANSLFVGGQVASQSSLSLDENGAGGSKQSKNEFSKGNGVGIPLLFSCLRRYLIKWWLESVNEHYFIERLSCQWLKFRWGAFCFVEDEILRSTCWKVGYLCLIIYMFMRCEYWGKRQL